MDTKKFIAEALNPKPRFSALRCALFIGLPFSIVFSGAAFWLGASPASTRTNVVAGFMAETIVKTPFVYTALVTGQKINDCSLVPNSQVGWAYNGLWRETEFAFINDTSPNSSRPTGVQSFGLWAWRIRPTDSRVRLTIQHMCGDKLILSLIGPFRF